MLHLIDRDSSRARRVFSAVAAGAVLLAGLVVLPATAASAVPGSLEITGGGGTIPAGRQFPGSISAFVQETDGSPSDGAEVRFAIVPDGDGTYAASFDATGTVHEATILTEQGETPGGVDVFAGASAGQVEVTVTVVGTALTASTFLTILDRVPDAPSIDALTPSLTSVEVAFSPGPPGGLPTTGYRVDARNVAGGAVTSLSGAGSPIALTGLAEGATYDVTVTALSGEWQSAPSAPQSVTLYSAPGAPTIYEKGGSDYSLQIQFTPGAPGNPAATYYLATVTDLDQGFSYAPVRITETAFAQNDLDPGLYAVSVVAVSPIATSPAGSSGPIRVLGDEAVEPNPTPTPTAPPASHGPSAAELAATGAETPYPAMALGSGMLAAGGVLTAFAARRAARSTSIVGRTGAQ